MRKLSKTYTHTYTHSHSHIHTHTYTLTHTHSHIHIHTHIKLFSISCKVSFCFWSILRTSAFQQHRKTFNYNDCECKVCILIRQICQKSKCLSVLIQLLVRMGVYLTILIDNKHLWQKNKPWHWRKKRCQKTIEWKVKKWIPYKDTLLYIRTYVILLPN